MSNPFSFNAPASSGASSGGLFGSTKPATTGGSLFGNIGGTSSGTQSPFGAANNSPGQNSLFGAKPAEAGSGASASPFGFGGAQNQNKPAGSLFGSLGQTPNKSTEAAVPAQTQTSQAQPAGGLFGAKVGTSSGGGLFGSNTPTQTKSGPGLFSTTPGNPPPANGSAGAMPSLFGSKPSQQQPSGTTGTATTTSSSETSKPLTTNIFGQNAGTTSNPLFGNAPSSTGGGSLFGSQTQTTSGTTSKPTFGAAVATPSTNAQSSPSLFKLPTANAASNPPPSSPFMTTASSTPATQPAKTAGAASEATPQKNLFNLGGTSSTTPSTTTATSSLFSGVGKPTSTTGSSTPATMAAATTTAPSGGLFGSTPAATSTTTTTTTTAATSAATPATSATAATTNATAAAPAATSAPSNAPKAQTPNLGASTFGPTPPAQSRLKNKTMDEIITRWATDLTKYQKDFKDQAEKVGEWDRMLVVNIAKVQKLYGNTVDAERATQEVERQLASVEGQQEELNAWLDRYEREVDEMLSKQVGPGESLQGPDQERERTYKLAEKLSGRLDEMGKDLGGMIEEINNTSSSLSKTNKTDEPISQIVRILNSHLSQLQMIDQGTSELQAKVSAAQKAGQSLGSRLGGSGQTSGGFGLGGNAADDFYRSYMGRR